MSKTLRMRRAWNRPSASKPAGYIAKGARREVTCIRCQCSEFVVVRAVDLHRSMVIIMEMRCNLCNHNYLQHNNNRARGIDQKNLRALFRTCLTCWPKLSLDASILQSCMFILDTAQAPVFEDRPGQGPRIRDFMQGPFFKPCSWLGTAGHTKETCSECKGRTR